MATPPSKKRKRCEMDTADKVKMLDRFHAMPSTSLREASVSLGISRTMLSNMLKGEEVLRKEFDNDTPSKKRNRSGKDKDVEDALLKWFQQMRTKNAPLNGPILCQKAEEIAKRMDHNDFKATDGWFNRWKKRSGLTFSKLQGDAADADEAAAMKWKEETFPEILLAYPVRHFQRFSHFHLMCPCLFSLHLRKKGNPVNKSAGY